MSNNEEQRRWNRNQRTRRELERDRLEEEEEEGVSGIESAGTSSQSGSIPRLSSFGSDFRHPYGPHTASASSNLPLDPYNVGPPAIQGAGTSSAFGTTPRNPDRTNKSARQKERGRQRTLKGYVKNEKKRWIELGKQWDENYEEKFKQEWIQYWDTKEAIEKEQGTYVPPTINIPPSQRRTRDEYWNSRYPRETPLSAEIPLTVSPQTEAQRPSSTSSVPSFLGSAYAHRTPPQTGAHLWPDLTSSVPSFLDPSIPLFIPGQFGGPKRYPDPNFRLTPTPRQIRSTDTYSSREPFSSPSLLGSDLPQSITQTYGSRQPIGSHPPNQPLGPTSLREYDISEKQNKLFDEFVAKYGIKEDETQPPIIPQHSSHRRHSTGGTQMDRRGSGGYSPQREVRRNSYPGQRSRTPMARRRRQ